MLAAYALTEPGSGSDATAARTTAVLSADGTHYTLNGVKQFITNAGFADLFTSSPRSTARSSPAFLVERAFPGVSTGPEEQKLGIKGLVDAPADPRGRQGAGDHLLGEIGRGHKIAFNILNVGRFKLGCGAAGAARECLDGAISYASDRKQFGKPIATFGAIQQKIADMATRIFVADAMSYRTAGSWTTRPAARQERARLPAAGHRRARRVHDRVLDHQSLRHRVPRLRRRRGAADARRLRLHQRVPDRAPLPRRAHQPHLRGHERDQPPDHPGDLDEARRQGRDSLLQFLQKVQEEIGEVGRRPLCTLGPLGQRCRPARWRSGSSPTPCRSSCSAASPTSARSSSTS
jgi:hypothetical protein